MKKMKSVFLAFLAIVISSTAIHVNAQFALSGYSDYYVNPCPGRDYKNPCPEKVYEDWSNKKMEQANNHSNASYLRVVKNFRKEFPQINNENWYKIPEGYLAYFKENAMKTSVVYNKKGILNHRIIYYGEKNLPRDIWENIKSSYYTYQILNVAEVHIDHQTIYIVYIQNEKYSKTVTVWNDNIEEVKNLKRG